MTDKTGTPCLRTSGKNRRPGRPQRAALSWRIYQRRGRRNSFMAFLIPAKPVSPGSFRTLKIYSFPFSGKYPSLNSSFRRRRRRFRRVASLATLLEISILTGFFSRPPVFTSAGRISRESQVKSDGQALPALLAAALKHLAAVS